MKTFTLVRKDLYTVQVQAKNIEAALKIADQTDAPLNGGEYCGSSFRPEESDLAEKAADVIMQRMTKECELVREALEEYFENNRVHAMEVLK